jgi:starch synthase
MKVLSAVSELFPLVKTGGLADVTGALPAALAPYGVDMLSLVPGYPAVLAGLEAAEVVHAYPDLFGGPARLLRGRARSLDVVAVDAPHLFDRPGNPYRGPDGRDWPDNARRFAALSRAAADFASGQAAGYRADILHCHDWQTGLGPVYAKHQGGPKSVLTVHNIAFQGQFPATVFALLGLPPEALGPARVALEFTAERAGEQLAVFPREVMDACEQLILAAGLSG